MESGPLDQAVELLEKANADLEPQLLSTASARDLLATYGRIEKLAAFGVAALAQKLDDAARVAQVTGTSMGRAKAAVATGKAMTQSDDLSLALQNGVLSRDQAAEIASAEESAPGAAARLLAVAESEPFHVLREKSRAARLDAEQPGSTPSSQARRRAASRSLRPPALGPIWAQLFGRPRHGEHPPRAGAPRRRADRGARRGRGCPHWQGGQAGR